MRKSAQCLDINKVQVQMLNDDILRDPEKRIDLHVSIIFSVIFILCLFRRFDMSRPTTNRVEFLFLASRRFKPLQPFPKIHGKLNPLCTGADLGEGCRVCEPPPPPL